MKTYFFSQKKKKEQKKKKDIPPEPIVDRFFLVIQFYIFLIYESYKVSLIYIFPSSQVRMGVALAHSHKSQVTSEKIFLIQSTPVFRTPYFLEA